MKTGFVKFVQSIVLAAAFGSGLAMAQSEPSMSEIYAAAKAGQMDKAQTMVQQVLVSHPHSAKAHYVRAELYAHEGNYARAREALAEAEKYAPGLPFAQATAVAELKAQLAQRAPVHAAATAAGTSSSSLNWLIPLALVAGVMALGYALFRRQAPQPAYAGPQPYANDYSAAPAYGTAYPPQASSLGSKVAGGLATGLAVGAGVVAAEAIGRRLFGEQDAPAHAAAAASPEQYAPIASNNDMGGDNFGIQDTSWDDGGSAGGSDWDN